MDTKIKALRPVLHNDLMWPIGSVMMVHSDLAAYGVGMGDMELASSSAPLSAPPARYVKRQKVDTGAAAITEAAAAIFAGINKNVPTTKNEVVEKAK